MGRLGKFWDRLKEQVREEVAAAKAAQAAKNKNQQKDSYFDEWFEEHRLVEARAERAGLVYGRHYTDWGPDMDRLRSLGKSHEDEYLHLVLACVDAAERVAAIRGREPAPGYTKRAAIIYRRRKDYAAEVAVIERWIRACPPEKGDLDNSVLGERLIKALKLRDREQERRAEGERGEETQEPGE